MSCNGSLRVNMWQGERGSVKRYGVEWRRSADESDVVGYFTTNVRCSRTKKLIWTKCADYSSNIWSKMCYNVGGELCGTESGAWRSSRQCAGINGVVSVPVDGCRVSKDEEVDLGEMYVLYLHGNSNMQQFVAAQVT